MKQAVMKQSSLHRAAHKFFGKVTDAGEGAGYKRGTKVAILAECSEPLGAFAHE